MRRSVLLVLIAAASLMGIWSFAIWAQVIDTTPCESACHDRHSMCISACGTHDNPMECEAGCDDEREDCLEQCG